VAAVLGLFRLNPASAEVSERPEEVDEDDRRPLFLAAVDRIGRASRQVCPRGDRQQGLNRGEQGDDAALRGDSSLQDFFFVRFMVSTLPSNVRSVSRSGCYRCPKFLESV